MANATVTRKVTVTLIRKLNFEVRSPDRVQHWDIYLALIFL